jgi:hypothetical protein
MTDQTQKFVELERRLVKLFGRKDQLHQITDENLGFMLEIALELEEYGVCINIREEMRARNEQATI